MAAAQVIIRKLGVGDECFVADAIRYWGREADADKPIAFLADPAVIAIGAFTADTLIGFVYGYVQTRPDDRPMAQLYSLDVWPGFRRRGIASRIVQAFRHAAGEVSKVWLITATDNQAANALYEALGGEKQQIAENVYYWRRTT